MSESEIRKARMEVDRSTARLDHALDRLVERIQEGTERFESARSQMMEMREHAMSIRDQVESAVHDPEATVRELIRPTVEKVGHFISQKSQAMGEEAKATLEQSFKETGAMADEFIHELQGRADSLIGMMESRPYASWLTVFFMGVIAGGLMARRWVMGADRMTPADPAPEAKPGGPSEYHPREAA